MVFAARLFARLLMETMTVVLEPGASVPLVLERVVQVFVLEAVQPIEPPPIFFKV